LILEMLDRFLQSFIRLVLYRYRRDPSMLEAIRILSWSGYANISNKHNISILLNGSWGI